MRIYKGVISEESITLLKDQIGKSLKSFRIWDIAGKGVETFDTVGLHFENCNIQLSCSCDHYDYSQQVRGDYTDVAVFKVVDYKEGQIPDPLLEMTPTDIPVGEKLTSIRILREEVVTHFKKVHPDDTIIHDRGIIFVFETKNLMVLKSLSWSDSLDVLLVSEGSAIPMNSEWENTEDESYTVKESEEIIN